MTSMNVEYLANMMDEFALEREYHLAIRREVSQIENIYGERYISSFLKEVPRWLTYYGMLVY